MRKSGRARAGADLGDDVRGDGGRGEAEAHFGEGDHACSSPAIGDVGGGDETGAPADRGAVDAGDDGLRALGDGAEHGGEALGVGAVLGFGGLGHAAHPVEVCAGGEGLALRR